MKRLLTVLCVLLLVASSARAEIVGRAGDDYIHQWIAPNGQAIYYVSQEEEPYVRMEDVNFDGVEDIVVMTFRGASNFGAEFFVWDGGHYVPVTHTGADSLVNHELYPELGLVETNVQEGWAGALHIRQLWRWKGTDLELVRTATGSEVSTMTFEGDLVTVVTDNTLVQLRVWDNLNVTDEPALLMDVTLSHRDADTMLAAEKEENRVLWQGLR